MGDVFCPAGARGMADHPNEGNENFNQPVRRHSKSVIFLEKKISLSQEELPLINKEHNDHNVRHMFGRETADTVRPSPDDIVVHHVEKRKHSIVSASPDPYVDLAYDKTSADFIPAPKGSQVLAAIAVSLGSMIIGFSSSYTSPAIPTMSAERNSSLVIETNSIEASWIGSLLPLGALLGSVVGGNLIEKIGRKHTILFTAIPFILSYVIIFFAKNIWMLYASRFITGMCVGIASLCLPVYLAETLQPEIRGTLGLMPTALGNIGILICFVSGTYLNWQMLALLGAVLCLPFLLSMLLIPETPRWYISNGQDEQAEKALQWLRGSKHNIRSELNEIKTSHIKSQKHPSRFHDLVGKLYRKPLIVSLGLMLFQQFSGINAVIFYTVQIFYMSGSSVDPNLSTIIVGLVNFSSTFVSILLIDRTGRKVLLLISSAVMIICLTVLAVFFYMKETNQEQVEGLGWIPLVSFIIFVMAFSLGWGPVPWLMMGEVFPGSVRGSAAATATFFNWLCTFAVTNIFLLFVSIFGSYVVFIMFAVTSCAGVLFVLFYVPETRGESLEDIEKRLTRNFRRISSTANLKPFPTTL